MAGSKQPRKQRRAMFQAPTHERRKIMSAHLAEDLMLKYERRSMPIRVGDTVRALRGDFAGETGEVLDIDLLRFRVEIDGMTLRKADGTEVDRPIHPSNLEITELDLSDPKRREKLERKGVDVEEPEPEPEPEAAEETPEPADEAETETDEEADA